MGTIVLTSKQASDKSPCPWDPIIELRIFRLGGETIAPQVLQSNASLWSLYGVSFDQKGGRGGISPTSVCKKIRRLSIHTCVQVYVNSEAQWGNTAMGTGGGGRDMHRGDPAKPS